MTKQEFLVDLGLGLSCLPQEDAEERLSFYSEMIDDRIEEGLSEEEAVREMGAVDGIVSQIVAEVPLSKLVKKKIKPKRRLRAWEIVLLVLGSPIWFSLLIAAFSVVISLYVSVWAIVISLWAVFAAFVGCFIGGLTAGILLICTSRVAAGILLIGLSLLSAGLSIFMFFGCREIVKGMIFLAKKVIRGVKHLFIRKEN